MNCKMLFRQPEDSVVQGGVNAVQNHMFQDNAKYPIARCSSFLLITSVGERTQSKKKC